MLSAPSGAGKTAITDALLASESALRRSVSMTTRAPRVGEVDGVHYQFVTEAEFIRARDAGELLEWARVLRGNYYYGTPRTPVDTALTAGFDVAFDIDWQGHRALRGALRGDVVGVFILPPSMPVLEARLRSRAGDDAAEIVRRMQLARDEIGHWSEYDHVVVNDDLSHAIEAVRSVLHAARLATARQTALPEFVRRLGA